MEHNRYPLFLFKALTIGDHLLTALERDNVKEKDVISGLTGILIFILQLYEINPDLKYISAAKKGIDKLSGEAGYICDNPSLYKGYMGAAYISMRIYQLTGDEKHKGKALELADKSAKYLLHYGYASDTLFNGRAGILQALLHLHAISGERRLLNMINQFIGKIIKNAKSDGRGLFWSTSNTNVRGECGYGYGASGTASVFLELGYYFRNEAFYYIAEKAFQYEDWYYNEQKKNWPGYTKNITTPEMLNIHKAQFLSGDFEYFSASDDDISLSRGAIGIGLVRIRAFQMTNDHTYLMDIDRVCKKLMMAYADNGPSFLDGGKAGFGLFFVQAFQMTKDPAHKAFALRIAEDLHERTLFDSSSGNDDDLSLFNGLAGTGLFLLAVSGLSFGLPVPGLTMTAHDLDEAVKYPWISLSALDAKKIFLEKDFPGTTHLMGSLFPADLHNYLEEMSGKDGSKEFIQWMQKARTEKDWLGLLPMKTVFLLECRKKEISANISSGAYLHIKEICRQEVVDDFLRSEEESMMNQWLVVEEDVELIETLYPGMPLLYMHYDIASFPPENKYITLLKPTAQDLIPMEGGNPYSVVPWRAGQTNFIEEQLDEMQQVLLRLFKDPCEIKNAIKRTTSAFYNQAPVISEKLALQYIKNFLKAGILRPCSRSSCGTTNFAR